MYKIKSLLSAPGVPEGFSFVGGIIVDRLLNVLLPSDSALILRVLLIAMVSFVIFALVILFAVRQDIAAQVAQFGLETHTLYAHNTPRGDRGLYNPLMEMIKSAEESLRVVGLYRPPGLQSSEARKEYYEAVEEVLRRHHKSQTSFTYERILQVRTPEPGSIGSSQLDEISFQHCQFLLRLKSTKTPVTVRLHQISDILGSLSFLIIDDKHVVFAIPTPNETENGHLEASQLGTAVRVTDYDGSLVREMSNLFGELAYRGTAVTSVT